MSNLKDAAYHYTQLAEEAERERVMEERLETARIVQDVMVKRDNRNAAMKHAIMVAKTGGTCTCWACNEYRERSK